VTHYHQTPAKLGFNQLMHEAG